MNPCHAINPGLYDADAAEEDPHRTASVVSVAFSLVWLVVKRVREASAEPSSEGAAAMSVRDGVVAYYCHGKERCENCRNYEAYSKEIIENEFAKPLAQGLLYWQVVDFDKPANKHFDEDYQLGGAATLVLVRMEGGTETESKVLRDGLMLVAMGEKDKLTEYVQTELGAFLAKQQTSRQETRGGYLFGLAWALWLGVFTSVTPCPLATNIAAVSYIGRRVGKTRQVLLTRTALRPGPYRGVLVARRPAGRRACWPAQRSPASCAGT